MRSKYYLFVLAFVISIPGYTQSGSLHVKKTGAGSPIIYLPGFTCPGTVWNETIQQQKGKFTHYQVSYPGFAGVAPVQTPWYETVKKDLLAYISAQNLTGITVIGHSLGGMLALDIAAAMPERFSKLVIVDALPCLREVMMPGVTADQVTYDNPYNKQMLQMDANTFEKSVQAIATSMTAKKEKADTLTAWMVNADRKTYVSGYTDLLKLDLRPLLPQIKAKVLILGASNPDKQTVQKIYNGQYETLVNKTLEIAPDSRHFIMFDQPEWFYEQVNSFLSK